MGRPYRLIFMQHWRKFFHVTTKIVGIGSLFSFIFLLLISISTTQAQDDIPLVGPFVAVNTSNQDQILIYDTSTGATRSLNFGDGWHMVWGFTDKGCRVVYTLSDGLAPARLYSAKLDGSDARELVQYDELAPENWGVWEPQPSPDGSKIAFTMIRSELNPDGTSDRTYHIAWIDAAGGEPQFYSVTGDEHEAEWSPDGAWLAYIGYTLRVPGADVSSTAVPTPEGTPYNPDAMLREADIWVVSADGETKYRLTEFPTGSVRAPRWSPDGELVGFIYAPSPNNDQFWMIGNAANAIPTELSYRWSLILDITWLPDSTAMLASARDFQDVADNVLWRVPLVGNADTDAVRYPGDPNLTFADYPRFSPDGNLLALRSEYAIILVDMSAGTWTLLDSLGIGNTPPVWSPADFPGEANCTP